MPLSPQPRATRAFARRRIKAAADDREAPRAPPPAATTPLPQRTKP